MVWRMVRSRVGLGQDQRKFPTPLERARKADRGSRLSRSLRRGITPALTSEDLPLPEVPSNKISRSAAGPGGAKH